MLMHSPIDIDCAQVAVVTPAHMGNGTARMDAAEKHPEKSKVRPAQMKVVNKLYCRLAPEYLM